MNLILLLLHLLLLDYSKSYNNHFHFTNRFNHIMKMKVASTTAISPKLLFTFPNCSKQVQSVKQFIHNWAKEQSTIGSAISFQVLEHGVQFIFTPSPGSYLDIYAEVIEKDVLLQSELNIKGGNQQVQSLIKLAGNSLIDSMVNEIDTLALSLSPLNNMFDSVTNDNIENPSTMKVDKPVNQTIPSTTSQVVQEESKPSKKMGDDYETATANEIQKLFPNLEMELLNEDQIDFDYLEKHAKDLQMPTQENIQEFLEEVPIDPENEIGTDKKQDDKLPNVSKTISQEQVKDTNTYVKKHQTDAIPVDSIETSPNEPLQDTTINQSPSVNLSMQLNQPHELFIIDNVSNKFQPILTDYLNTWISKYANRGTGIFSQSVVDGIIISFYLDDSFDLKLSSRYDSGRIYVIYYLMKKGKKKVVASNPSEKDQQDAIIKVIQTLLSKCQDHLKNILIDPEYHQSSVLPSSTPIISEKVSSSFLTEGTVQEDSTPTESISKNSIPSTHEILEIPDDSNYEIEEAIQKVNAATSSISTSVPLPKSSAPRKIDPELENRAKRLGVRLEKFADVGMEDQAIEELNNMLRQSRSNGLYSIMREVNSTWNNKTSPVDTENNMEWSSLNLMELFEVGKNVSDLNWREMIQRPISSKYDETVEDLLKPTTKLPMYMKDSVLANGRGGMDLFEGPPGLQSASARQLIDTLDDEKVHGDGQKKVSKSISPPNLEILPSDQAKLDRLIQELQRNGDEIHSNILDSYRDLLLSDNLLYLLQQANDLTTELNDRLLYKKIIDASLLQMNKLAELMKAESLKHMQTIYEICDVAYHYQHDEGEFLKRLEPVKIKMDTSLLYYLKYMIREEEQKILLQQGVDFNRMPTGWYQILQIIYQGVLKEFEIRYDRLIEPLLLVTRFDQDPDIRSNIFARFVNKTATIDLPYLRELAVNMIDSILKQDEKTLPDPTLHQKMKNLQLDVNQYLSLEYIEMKMKSFEMEAYQQGMKLVIEHRNPAWQAQYESNEDLEKYLMNERSQLNDENSKYLNSIPNSISERINN